MNVVTGRSGHWFSLWGNGLGLDRAGRYLHPFFPPGPANAARAR